MVSNCLPATTHSALHFSLSLQALKHSLTTRSRPAPGCPDVRYHCHVCAPVILRFRRGAHSVTQRLTKVLRLFCVRFVLLSRTIGCDRSGNLVITQPRRLVGNDLPSAGSSRPKVLMTEREARYPGGTKSAQRINIVFDCFFVVAAD